MLLAGKSLSFVLTPTPAIELGGSLIKNTDINLAGYVLTASGNGRVGIGLTSSNASSKVHIRNTDITGGPGVLIEQQNTGATHGLSVFTNSSTTGIAAIICIPSAFSSNGDGVNDLSAPSVTGIRNARWTLYDRWEMEVFRGEGLPIVWDGTKGGQVCPEGVYTYLIELERFDGEKVRKAGTITLLR